MTQELIQQLTAALREAVRALNVQPRFKVQETNSYSIAALCDAALKAAGDYRPASYETCRAFARDCKSK